MRLPIRVWISWSRENQRVGEKAVWGGYNAGFAGVEKVGGEFNIGLGAGKEVSIDGSEGNGLLQMVLAQSSLLFPLKKSLLSPGNDCDFE